jgi:hypothetical protein
LITGMTRGQIPIPCLSMVEKQNCLWRMISTFHSNKYSLY